MTFSVPLPSDPRRVFAVTLTGGGKVSSFFRSFPPLNKSVDEIYPLPSILNYSTILPLNPVLLNFPCVE